ncbi:MAG: hypothetical protein N838_11320 [Thiohalocapsa sp. PB-PSB1]|nr:MAG: hypothetical protein N838_11320 [Thiohalocapsa sp. PB-PSB1]
MGWSRVGLKIEIWIENGIEIIIWIKKYDTK